jgi:hypothetical protein
MKVTTGLISISWRTLFSFDIYFVCISSYEFVFSFRSVSSRKAALSDVVDTMFSKKWLAYLVFRQLEIRDAVIGNWTAEPEKCEGEIHRGIIGVYVIVPAKGANNLSFVLCVPVFVMLATFDLILFTNSAQDIVCLWSALSFETGNPEKSWMCCYCGWR